MMDEFPNPTIMVMGPILDSDLKNMVNKKEEHSYLIPTSLSNRGSYTSSKDSIVANKNISQQTLVHDGCNTNSSRLTQYVVAIIATVGGLIAGTTLGWTSPTEVQLKNGTYGFPISQNEMSWIGGSMPLGAILGCMLTGIFIDIMGRKNWILFLVLPCTGGWASMIWAQSAYMFYGGRFLTGITTGGFCLAIPIYTAEISEKEIRGSLGTYLQLQITIGILAMYIIGSYVNVFILTVICGVIPLVFFLLMAMLPDTPFFHLKKGNRHDAEKSLKWFRDSTYHVESELNIIQETIDKDNASKVSFKEAFQTRAAKRGLIIGLGVMFFQQFSGCNSIIFYTTSIFQASGSSLDSSLCTIIVGCVCVIATWVATMLVDKLGRRILLLLSIIMMALCLFSLAGYFYMKMDLGMDVNQLGWIPLSSLSVYVIAFSLGFGPIPWMLMGEIFPSQIRGCASSIACLFNWFCVFLITKFFPSFAVQFGIGKVFWFFVICCLVGTLYVYVLVPETKGKSLEEIQDMLGGESNRRTTSAVGNNKVLPSLSAQLDNGNNNNNNTDCPWRDVKM